jgi:hypothetical protein
MRYKLAALLALSIFALSGLDSGRRAAEPQAPAALALADAKDVEAIPEPMQLRWSRPSHAVQEALADPTATIFTRWVWCRRGDVRDAQLASWLVALTEDSTEHVLPDVGVLLVRIDLDVYWPARLQEAVDLWEDFAFDPSFSKIYTHDTLQLLSDLDRGKLHPRAWKRSWKKVDGEWVRAGRAIVDVDVKDTVLIRFNNREAESAGLSELQQRVQSFAPIVELDYFNFRISSTIKDRDGKTENVYSTIWGGRYYEWAGIRKSQKLGRTDLQQFFLDLGLTEDYDAFIEKARSEERAALFISDVTGKVRRIVWAGTSNSRLSVAHGRIWITQDVRDRDVDAGSHPVKNLVKSRIAAFEIIYNRSNGQLGYALFSGDGALLDEGAIDVVADHRVPSPNSPRLQPMKSCLGCHGVYDGLQPFDSDIDAVARFIDVFGDVSKQEKDKDVRITLDRLRGQYKAGNSRRPLRLARDDNAFAVQNAVGLWRGVPVGDVVKAASAHQERVYFRYKYAAVNAEEALRSLGIRTKGGDGVALELQRLIPLRERFEDPVLVALMAGRRVTRTDWDLSYSGVLERTMR